jgi:hypothetical protein
MVGSKGQLLGCILFAAAAWKSAGRDIWTGWSMNEREQNLGLVCNNTRFFNFSLGKKSSSCQPCTGGMFEKTSRGLETSK